MARANNTEVNTNDIAIDRFAVMIQVFVHNVHAIYAKSDTATYASPAGDEPLR